MYSSLFLNTKNYPYYYASSFFLIMFIAYFDQNTFDRKCSYKNCYFGSTNFSQVVLPVALSIKMLTIFKLRNGYSHASLVIFKTKFVLVTPAEFGKFGETLFLAPVKFGEIGKFGVNLVNFHSGPREGYNKIYFLALPNTPTLLNLHSTMLTFRPK